MRPPVQSLRLLSVSRFRPAVFADPLEGFLLMRPRNPCHAYIGHAGTGVALAGVGAVWRGSFCGPRRFGEMRDASDALLAGCHALGDVGAPFAGPHFFAACTFDGIPGRDMPAPATLFLPRWQLVRSPGGATVVANLLVPRDGPPDAFLPGLEASLDAFEARAGGAHGGCALRVPSGAAPTLTEHAPGWYPRAVARVLGEIASGRVQKVVLARAWRAVHPEGFDFAHALRFLCARHPESHAYAFGDGVRGTFFGATPECLASLVPGSHLRTDALAGTAPRDPDATADARGVEFLLRDEKERREHALVVLHLRHALARTLRLELPAAPPPRVLTLPHLHHLHTPLCVPAPGTLHLCEVAAALHPTPATAGYPVPLALRSIRELEPVPRGLYAGGLGWFDATGGGRFLVALRSAQLSADGREAWLHAGSGIVEGSSFEREGAEIHAKLRTLAGALQIPGAG
ncbi:MAG: chorismate-binding protein [Puniceicoccales bacterium]|nr:chorismate-binding protein [Puniceicoccales bacterium]